MTMAQVIGISAIPHSLYYESFPQYVYFFWTFSVNSVIKLEIDIDLPSNFNTEVRYLTKPVPFSVRTYAPEDLFAGKMHAVLCRPYKVRVKGRDWTTSFGM